MSNKNQNYEDDFFSKGNLVIKVKQSLIALFGWITVLIPMLILGMILKRHGLKIFGIYVDFKDLVIFGEFLLIILIFTFVVIGAFSISMAIIQHERSRHYLDKWPNFNPIERQVVIDKLNEFATSKYGDEEFRENVRTFVVPKELNIEDGKLQNLIKEDKEK